MRILASHVSALQRSQRKLVALPALKIISVNRLKQYFYQLLLFLTAISLYLPVSADVVKPALVEISVSTDERVEVEIRTSIEALLTEINGRFRNTTESPNAEAYDRYREMSAEDLTEAFQTFHDRLLTGVQLAVDGKPIPLQIATVNIPPPGYTKVPRASVIYLQGRIPRDALSLTWYYPLAFGDQAVRVRQVDQDTNQWHWSAHQWIREDRPTDPFSLTEVFAQPSQLKVMKTYVEAGFFHIVPQGWDHMLFIMGIFLMTLKLKPLLWQATMFTLAHSITLTAGVFDWIRLPVAIVEPLIALSIAYVAIENLFLHRMSRLRLPVVFAFGLLHGLGFASMLTDFGLPEGAYIQALLWFNVGVEFGQVAVLLAGYFALSIWFSRETTFRRWVTLPGSVLIGWLGLAWCYDRILYFWT